MTDHEPPHGPDTRRVATVFGGTGFIGRYVVQRLAAKGWIVRVAGRDPEAVRALMTQGRVGQIVPVAADVTDPGAVDRAVAGATAVINLVGILAERRAGDFTRLQTEGAGNVARAATATGVARLVQISAIGADPTSDSAYASSKGAGEIAVRAAFPTATILRPSLVFGAEDKFFNRFAGLARLLPFMPVISGDSRFQPVHVGDVADAVMAALERDDARGQTYELGGPRVATFRDLLRYVLRTIGRKRPLLEVPAGVAGLQARVAELLPNPPLTRDQLKMLGRDNVVGSGMSGLAALGIAATPIEAVVPGYLARFGPSGRRPAA